MTTETAKTPSPSVDAEAIRQLAGLLDDTGLSEIEYETENVRIRVAKNASVVNYAAAPAVAAAPVAAAPAATAPAAAVTPENHPGAIKAPMVGVTYLSPEPGADVFVTAGQAVKEGQTLMLIEAMKTFNPVKAPRSGTLVSLLVSDGSAVEYGETLAIIE